MRIGPVLEVTTNFQHFKYGIEIRIESVNKESSHSWVRISYETVKCVVDSQDNTEIPEDREYSLGRQPPYQYMKEDGLSLNDQNKILPRTIFRGK